MKSLWKVFEQFLKSETCAEFPITWLLHLDPIVPNHNAPNLKIWIWITWKYLNLWFSRQPHCKDHFYEHHYISQDYISKPLKASRSKIQNWHEYFIGLTFPFFNFDGRWKCFLEHESTWFHPVLHFVQICCWQQAWILHSLPLLQQPDIALQQGFHFSLFQQPDIALQQGFHFFNKKTLQGFLQCSKAVPARLPVQRGRGWSEDLPLRHC